MTNAIPDPGWGRVYITSAGNILINKAASISLQNATNEGGSPTYIATTGSGDIDIGWTSKEVIGDITISATESQDAYITSAGALNINGSGDITVTSSGSGSAYLTSTGAMALGGADSGRVRAGTLTVRSTDGTGDAYIESSDVLAIHSGAIKLNNEANNIATITYIEAAGNIDINSSGAIELLNRGAITSDVVKIVSTGGAITIEDCKGLSLLYDLDGGATPSGYGDIEIQAAGNLTIRSSGPVQLGYGPNTPNLNNYIDLVSNSGTVDITAGSLELNGIGNNSSQISSSSNGNTKINTGTGEVRLQHSGANSKRAVQIDSPSVEITCGDLLVLETKTESVSNRTQVLATNTLSLEASGDVSLVNGEIRSRGTMPTFTVGGTLTNDSGFIEADVGDVVLVANENVVLQGSAEVVSTAGSVIIACDQATRQPGSGHINISADSEITAAEDGKLRIFCGFFENNTISTEADLNGGTFSGVKDVTDANNIYNIVFDADNLPTEYGAPYTFYYEATTPEQTITAEIERANILLSATMVSSSTLSGDAAYTKLAQVRRSFVDRGRPFKFAGKREKRRRDA